MPRRSGKDPRRRAAPVVLLHGNPGTGADFERVFDLLGGDRDIRVIDRPGHGGASRSSTVLTLPEQARIIHAAVGDVDRPILVGFSYGGPVALAYAEEFPGDVRAIVLIASLGDPGAPHLRNPVEGVLALPVVGPLVAWTVGPLLAQGQIKDGLASAFAPDPVHPKCLASALATWSAPRALLAFAGDMKGLDESFAAVARRYDEIHVPVEVLVAEDDTVVPA
ncbi:MAG: alpha/beta fold hydrolase, partial [Polyangiaceae bacterium]